MKTILSALSATALVGVMLLGSVSDADARWRGGRGGGWVGPAIVGGAAAGLLLGSAIAAPRYYGPGPGTCLVDQEVWSPYYRAYVVRRVPVPC